MKATLLALCLALALPFAASAAEGEPPAPRPVEDDDPFAEEEKPVPPLADPIRPVNRAFYHVNDKLYFWLFRPVAQGWRAVVPKIARVGVSNFFGNLGTPRRFANCLLQGDLRGSGTELARLGVNSTVGLAGLADPARGWLKLRPRREDFGQTLGRYGIGMGLYLHWPMLGPSSPRDTVGSVADAALDPATYLPGAGILQRINHTSLHLGDYEDLKKRALDPYAAIRDAYNQRRRHAIATSD